MGHKPENTPRSHWINDTITRDLALFPNEKNIEVPLPEKANVIEVDGGLPCKIWLPIPKGLQGKN